MPMRKTGAAAMAAIIVLLTAFGRHGVANTANSDIASARTVAYCDVLNNPRAFKDEVIRVRALYETSFEESALTAPSCALPYPMTWVRFDESWESRTSWRIRHAMKGVQWGVQSDVVLIGRFKTEGHFGHLGMYPFMIEVLKVEAVKPSGAFRPLPQAGQGHP
jgi:hypothetical protein